MPSASGSSADVLLKSGTDALATLGNLAKAPTLKVYGIAAILLAASGLRLAEAIERKAVNLQEAVDTLPDEKPPA